MGKVWPTPCSHLLARRVLLSRSWLLPETFHPGIKAEQPEALPACRDPLGPAFPPELCPHLPRGLAREPWPSETYVGSGDGPGASPTPGEAADRVCGIFLGDRTVCGEMQPPSIVTLAAGPPWDFMGL